MIRSIRRGSHLSRLGGEELEVEARDWSRILFGVIPIHMLLDCQRLAEINPNRNQSDMSFPVKRREILDAYYREKAKSIPVPIVNCEFCRLHKNNPVDYNPCQFHSTENADIKQEAAAQLR